MEITKEDVLYFIYMRNSEKMGSSKRYYTILQNKDSEEYKRFINVYVKNKYVLPERERIVLDSVYGVNGTPLKLREVADVIKVTPERVRQLVYKSERKLVGFLRVKY
jgi:DNA-directed RNA polymerase specialized sigma subunit